MKKTMLISPLIFNLVWVWLVADGRTQQPPPPSDAPAQTHRGPSLARTVERIRTLLVTLPYYDVFDWLEGEVRANGTVILRGQVVRPTTKSDAEALVRNLEEVETVINEIEVLPPSPADDRLRIAVYRAIYSQDSPLFRYATRAVPPIHIIVHNSRLTLKGVVASEADKTIAYTRARGVPGLLDVRNELQVEANEDRGN